MTAAYPLERIRKSRTLADAVQLTEGKAEFVTFWQPGKRAEFESLCFREFFELSASYASLFQRHGLLKGETVALILPQGPDLMAAFMGAVQLGSVPTILAYPNFKVDPEKYRLGLTGVTGNILARLTVVDETFPKRLLERISGSGSGQILEACREDLPHPGNHFSSNARPEDIAVLQHSAGTTGLQKGVALTHRVILNQLLALGEALELDGQDRVASWLPLYHDMGLVACFLLPLVAGIPVVMESPVDWVMQPGSFLRLISEFRCTLAWLPNFAFQFLARRVDAGERSQMDLSSLKALTSSSEPVSRQSLKEFEEAYRDSGLEPAALQTSYAMAETTFAVTQSRRGERPRVIWVNRAKLLKEAPVEEVEPEHPDAYSLVSSGRCLRDSRVQVVDDRGDSLPERHVGELIVQNGYLFEGYFRRPDLTEEVLREGWYWTGDTGFVSQGDVFVIGRKDDLIIAGGRNLYPQDLEEIAFQHPLIRDGRAVAFGIFNPQLGTQDIVVVAEARSQLDLSRRKQVAAQIREEILLQLGIAPRHVEIVGSRWLIKSTAGKPARSSNRERFLRLRPDIAARYGVGPLDS